jgi:hypothetical protein
MSASRTFSEASEWFRVDNHQTGDYSVRPVESALKQGRWVSQAGRGLALVDLQGKRPQQRCGLRPYWNKWQLRGVSSYHRFAARDPELLLSVAMGTAAGAASRANSEEGIRDPEAAEPLTVLEILSKEEIALRLDCSGDDQ